MDSVVHFEIPADDVSRAVRFYKEIFGWDIQQFGDMPYWITRTVECDENNMPAKPGAINGGIMKRDDAGGGTPVIVINVTDVDKYAKKVEDMGGEIVMPKQDVGGMGLYVRVKDTEGNVIGLWQDIRKS